MQQRILNPFFSLLLLLCTTSNISLGLSHSLYKDTQILLRIKSTQLQDKNNILKDWVPNTNNPCNWTGITCDARKISVVSINLSHFNLSGEFPCGFCYIHTLRKLSLGYNYLGKTINTHSFSICSHLRVLDLTENLFIGELPEFRSEFSQIRVLDLSFNNFSGEIPASFGRFPQLKSLRLVSNLFGGIVPSFLGNLSALRNLEIGYNPFKEGPLPWQLGNLSKLETLFISNANLVGSIPDSIGNLVSLKNIDLSSNYLSGEIPNSIFGLKYLEQIELFDNNLQGELPESLGNLTNLLRLDLGQNNLTGKLPHTIGSLSLISLRLNENLFYGEIPSSLALNPNLLHLALFANNFTGKLPQHLGLNSDLEDFDVSNNQLTGELPKHLCKRKRLQSILLFNNKFSGTLPSQFGDCHSLTVISIENNQLSGDVPSKFWNHPSFEILKMQHNMFSGSISNSISNAKGLSKLHLQGNNFSGMLPIGICELQRLMKFDVSKNLLTGEVPACITRLKKLEFLRLQENMFTGPIPSNLSFWHVLTELNLSYNQFSGTIPSQLSYLRDLTYLDLSMNSLTGNVPPELVNLGLSEFNVSGNKLYGEVPYVFRNPVFLSGLMGNPGLCSSVLKEFPPCSKQKPFSLIAVIIFAACFLLFMGFVLLFLKRKFLFFNGKSYERSYKTTTFQIVGFSEEDIVPFLTSENLIGSGSSGQVYKVDLNNGEFVAAKKLWGGTRKLETESVFKSEIEILGRIRHANIVKLLFSCSADDDLMVLVYEYMENGSLGDVLHVNKCEELREWSTRFNIAVGAAQGLAYLHHACVPPILHRDIKSNNILLDRDFLPRVADFGLAKTLQHEEGGIGDMSRIAGSYGYIAPEYGYTLKVTEKGDVYSFGVVLMELITGKRPNDPSLGDNMDIVKWVTETAFSSAEDQPIDLAHIIDPMLNLATCDYEEIESVLNVALLCTTPFPMNRPTMKRVVELLKELKLARHN
ncbi:hypothetical protein TanjilG_28054 [Lupinus angustifolius]|uniref:non-specific serine/threonine protein kinase n=1 Tax=Lupinus angustifolius TaxID=3871 RepID=A0A4P1RG13_LUPAN|nr:PREDICTED: LRR receptor-like serine/threonine-protein kinase HSL2 [Lupinus angustifolius]OIW10303.1 hypothetical protein TanjilG_28054 [Lupinus angustifolius]